MMIHMTIHILYDDPYLSPAYLSSLPALWCNRRHESKPADRRTCIGQPEKGFNGTEPGSIWHENHSLNSTLPGSNHSAVPGAIAAAAYEHQQQQPHSHGCSKYFVTFHQVPLVTKPSDFYEIIFQVFTFQEPFLVFTIPQLFQVVTFQRQHFLNPFLPLLGGSWERQLRFPSSASSASSHLTLSLFSFSFHLPGTTP